MAFEYITQFVFCVIHIVLKTKFITWWTQKVGTVSPLQKVGSGPYIP